MCFSEDENQKEYCWLGSILPTNLMVELAQQWAQANGVTEDVVGFETETGEQVDKQSTPEQLGWRAGGKVVTLEAVPLCDE